MNNVLNISKLESMFKLMENIDVMWNEVTLLMLFELGKENKAVKEKSHFNNCF